MHREKSGKYSRTLLAAAAAAYVAVGFGVAATAWGLAAWAVLGFAGAFSYRALRKSLRATEAEYAEAVGGRQDAELRLQASRSEVREYVQSSKAIQITTANLQGRVEEDAAIIAETLRGAEGLSAQAQTLRGVAATLAADTAEILKAANSLVQTSGSAAGSSDRLAAGLEDVAATMQQMAAQIVQVSRNVQTVNEKGRSAERHARKGGETVTNALGAIEKVRRSNNELQATAQYLSGRTRAIGQIVDTIEDIADQTNLLALNAAIEAARAGDAGRGFAVVADEIRKLAARTIQATEEISTTVEEVQKDTEQALTATANLIQETEKLLDNAEQTGTSFAEIVEQVQEIAGMLDEVAVAADEQNKGVDSVVKSITELESAAQETRAIAAEQNGTSERILQSIANVDAATRTVSTSAENQQKALKPIVMALISIADQARENTRVAIQIQDEVGRLLKRA